MKAVVIHAAHDLRVEESDVPPVGAHDVKIRIRAGGICGSDLHYYHHGGFGAVRLREKMILGHEIAGEVIEIGAAVTSLTRGARVAVNPSRPCGRCRYCLQGQPQHCFDMQFYGSAMRMPHVQGAFREILVCDAAQAIVVPDGVSLQHAAFAEPLSVCLHAARQAGPLLGQRVLVTGAGPIGALAILVARQAGAREVVATDLVSEPLTIAKRIGADRVLNLQEDPTGLDHYSADKGYFDVVFEASGSGPALAGALEAARPGATVVQIGLGGATTFPLNLVVTKEISLRGTFRFHEEFAWAVDFIASGAINVAPLLSAAVPIDDAVRGFELASDRRHAMKVQIAM